MSTGAAASGDSGGASASGSRGGEVAGVAVVEEKGDDEEMSVEEYEKEARIIIEKVAGSTEIEFREWAGRTTVQRVMDVLRTSVAFAERRSQIRAMAEGQGTGGVVELQEHRGAGASGSGEGDQGEAKGGKPEGRGSPLLPIRSEEEAFHDTLSGEVRVERPPKEAYDSLMAIVGLETAFQDFGRRKSGRTAGCSLF